MAAFSQFNDVSAGPCRVRRTPRAPRGEWQPDTIKPVRLSDLGKVPVVYLPTYLRTPTEQRETSADDDIDALFGRPPHAADAQDGADDTRGLPGRRRRFREVD